MFGNILKALRMSKGYSMDKFVEVYNKRFDAKMNKSTLSRYENGLQEPMYTTVVNIATFFNVTVEYLTGVERLSAEELTMARKKIETLASESVDIGDFQDAFNTNYMTFRAWLKGNSDYFDHLVPLLCSYFGTSMSSILGKNEKLLSPTITEKTTTFPVIGEIAAGYNKMAMEDWSGETVEIPDSYLKGHNKEEFFVLSVHGDSMFPIYQEGDKVLILRQDSVGYSGNIGAVLYEDELATLKKVEYVEGEDWMRLVPLNPNFKPMLIEDEALTHCKILGIPKFLLREIK